MNVVALSNVKVWNPYQLVVFSRTGDRLLELNLIGMRWPGTSESVTNWVRWYKTPVPKIAIVEGRNTAILSVEDGAGFLRKFEFALAR